MRLLTTAASLSLCLLAACGPSEEVAPPTLAATRQELSAVNGGTMNGGTMNGGTMNGGFLNGNDLSGVLVGVHFAGAVLQGGTSLDHTELRGTRFWGSQGSTVYTGADFLLAGFTGTMGNGSAVQLRVASMSTGTGANADLDLYFVEYLDAGGLWKPACHDPATGAATSAIPVNGRWDYRQGVPGGGARLEDAESFTFACRGAAIAKCVEWGYRPWTAVNGVAIAPYHQACTRLVRADYCGDGQAHTQNGNRINLFDKLGIQHDTENWLFESNWDINGSRCIHPLNRHFLGALPCLDLRLNGLCGLLPDSGALLTSETPLLGLLP